jgi:hypothetical protein
MTLERSNTNSARLEDLSVWDFSESFTADEILGLILGTGNHHEYLWEVKKPPYQRMVKAFEAAHQQIFGAYLDADIPFEGDPAYEIPYRSPINLHSMRDQDARKKPSTANVRLAANESFDDARFSRVEIDRWLQAINAKSRYSFCLEVSSEPATNDKKPITPTELEDRPLNSRERTTYLNIIGGLLDLMLGSTPGGQKKSAYDTRDAIISAMLAHHGGKPGIAESTLDKKFTEAKRSVNAT